MSDSITIYHNPACSISRNALAMIRERGIEPQIIEYLKTPPSREKLSELIGAMGIKPRDLLRRKEATYQELDLDNPKWSDADLIGFMVSNPILMNRPIVVTSLGTRLGRPSEEAVLDILPSKK
jgi:arsenate reductase